MDIKDVQLLKNVMVETEQYFAVTLESGATLSVPIDPSNRHYRDIENWYNEQNEKPFNFEFKQLGEPVFAETIYPPEPEEPEDETVPAEPKIIELPEEPETLLPK